MEILAGESRLTEWDWWRVAQNQGLRAVRLWVGGELIAEAISPVERGKFCVEYVWGYGVMMMPLAKVDLSWVGVRGWLLMVMASKVTLLMAWLGS